MSSTLVENHLRSIDPGNPLVDRRRAKRALAEHLHQIGLAPLRMEWAPRPTAAGDLSQRCNRNRSYEQRRFFGSKTWSRSTGSDPIEALVRNDVQAFWAELGIARFWNDTRRAHRNEGRRRGQSAYVATRVAFQPLDAASSQHGHWSRILAPLAEAAAAGLFAYWIRKDRALLLARPRMLIEAGLLHCWDGRPAVSWPGGSDHYFWRGFDIGPRLGANPEHELTVARIRRRTNAEIRRVLLERYGWERYLRDSRAELLGEDRYGRLWQTRWGYPPEHVALLDVDNSTPEPDGSRKRYFLRVPPEMRTPREAVAWTFGIGSDQEYAPVAES